ncbi:MAG: hypothetical protein PHC53_02430 [Patescibacteria group bacterium]|nr:hypothetical protein [Patescibacteria group bacterium]
MKTESKYLVSFFLAVFLTGSLFLPQGVEAATKKAAKALPRCNKGFCVAKVSITPGADEKDYANPTTRCLTAEMKKRHDQVVAQMNKDIAKYQGRDSAIKTYQKDIDILWSAMHEPYCGYGSYGMTAVKHSWDKTISHVRTEFLEAVGANQVAKK